MEAIKQNTQHPLCAECGRVLNDESDSTLACILNQGFSDETTVCQVCKDSMLDCREITCCESCRLYFTYDHLIPNKDDPDDTAEICPFCGQIWDK